ncbi:MAG: SGNH/GDSL hydrolase family protein [Chloroflexi bacterium]|nr:SGNH/GDSL hydrolase family protein [Chloroflexota bacterium]
MKSLGNFLGRLLLIVLGVLAPLFVLEIGVRWLDLAPPPEPNPAIWQPHPLLGWWHIPYSGGLFHSSYNEFEAEVRINARGLRDREIGYENLKGALRILSLADSFGEALQVNLDQTYYKQLEGMLADSLGRPVEVINGGVGGWGTDQEAIFYVAEGFRYQPEMVLLAYFVRNDAVNNYGPLEIARTGGSQQKEFFSLSPDGKLMPPPVQGEAKTEAKAESMVLSVEPRLQSDNGPLLLSFADGLWRWSALYRLVTPYLRDIPPVVQKVGPSGILGGEGVVRAGHPTTPIDFFIYQSPPNQDFEAAWNLTEAIIKRLRDEVESRGAKLAVVIIGAPEQVYPAEGERMLAANPGLQGLNLDLELPNRRLADFLTAEKIPYLDLLPIFREAAARPETPPLHFRHDGHWTVAGHRLAAEAIYDFLRNELGSALK